MKKWKRPITGSDRGKKAWVYLDEGVLPRQTWLTVDSESHGSVGLTVRQLGILIDRLAERHDEIIGEKP